MKKLILTCLLTSLPFASLQALEIPKSTRYDNRVKYVNFNSQDVVQLDSVVGIVTHIVLESDEVYKTHAFGDSAAYDFAVDENHIFIKPIAEDANTNLIIVTNKRVYKFRLSFRHDLNGAIYSLAFNYPDTRAKFTSAQIEKQRLEQAFRTKANEANLKYSMSGNTEIAPINAWDDGRFTYLKFSPNTDFPAVYILDATGQESLVNFNTIGKSNNIIQVHKVHQKFYLRSGSRVLAIYNDAYDSIGTPNITGTASPAVERIIDGGQ